MPTVIAALTRIAGDACFATIDEANPAIPDWGEIYGRFLVPTQPAGSLISTAGKAELRRLLDTARGAERLSWGALALEYEALGSPQLDFRFTEDSELARRVRRAARQQAADALIYQRVAPTWEYFHAPRSGLTVVHCKSLARLIRASAAEMDTGASWLGPKGLFISEGALRATCIYAGARRRRSPPPSRGATSVWQSALLMGPRHPVRSLSGTRPRAAGHFRESLMDPVDRAHKRA